MDSRNRYRAILEALQRGELDIEDAIETLTQQSAGPQQNPDVRIDHDRESRTGVPEIVWAEGKTLGQLLEAVRTVESRGRGVLVSRVQPDQGEPLVREFPAGTWYRDPRLFVLEDGRAARAPGRVAVACAGTSDVSVAEEAALTAEFLGIEVDRAYDIGVAGIHRLLAERDRLAAAGIVIVVAGMEGALPSVVAGLVPGLVIAVPTSVGYGLHLGGVTPFLAMLNSCAPGVLVTNVDNGLGAGVAAAKLHHRYQALKDGSS